GGQFIARCHIPHKQRVFITQLVVGAAEDLVLVDFLDGAILYLSARTLRGGQLLHDRQCLLAELARRNLAVRIINARRRIMKLNKIAAAEVAGKHAGCRYETRQIGGIRARIRSLVSTEEKQLVGNDRAAERAAVLIALQSVSARGIGIAGIENTVSKE